MTTFRPDELVQALESDFINCWMPIAQTTLGQSVTSVVFSSIPSTFRTLVMFVQVRTDRSAEIDRADWRLNGDGGNNYDRLGANFSSGGLATGVNRATSSGFGVLCEAANSRASNFGGGYLIISGYKKTDREKVVYARGHVFGDVSADTDIIIDVAVGRWRSTAAVNSITMIPNTGTNFVAGSIFALYGVL